MARGIEKFGYDGPFIDEASAEYKQWDREGSHLCKLQTLISQAKVTVEKCVPKGDLLREIKNRKLTPKLSTQEAEETASELGLKVSKHQLIDAIEDV